MLIQKTIVVGPFQCNCRLIVCSKTGEAALVDPGDEAEKIVREFQSVQTTVGRPLTLKYLLHTHGHLDHIGAAREMREKFSQTQICLHREDQILYQNLKMQGQLFGMSFEDPLPIDHFLEEGEALKVGEFKLTMVHTPGHSPGSLCIRLHEDSALQAPETVFSGDTLFQGSVGRTDLWGANQDTMFKSIYNRILTLDDDTRVCPGHGRDTSIGIEKRENPFLTRR